MRLFVIMFLVVLCLSLTADGALLVTQGIINLPENRTTFDVSEGAKGQWEFDITGSIGGLIAHNEVDEWSFSILNPRVVWSNSDLLDNTSTGGWVSGDFGSASDTVSIYGLLLGPGTFDGLILQADLGNFTIAEVTNPNSLVTTETVALTLTGGALFTGEAGLIINHPEIALIAVNVAPTPGGGDVVDFSSDLMATSGMQIVLIPEPVSITCLLAGLMGLIGFKRRS